MGKRNPMDVMVEEKGLPVHLRSLAGLDPDQSHEALGKWCQHNRPLLTWACSQAFDVGEPNYDGSSSVFVVTVDLTAEANEKKEQKPSKMFKVIDAELCSKATLAHGIWGGVIACHDKMMAKIDKKDRLGQEVAFMMIVCRLHMSFMRIFWDKAEFPAIRAKKNPNWLAVLKQSTP